MLKWTLARDGPTERWVTGNRHLPWPLRGIHGDTMTITARGLNRAMLARQLLLRRESLPVTEAVRRVVALQAQQAASPYIALWNRVSDFDPTELDAAYAAHEVVKATLMRITLHAVHADDYQPFREAMEPTLRAVAHRSGRLTSSGLSAEDVDALVDELHAHAHQPRTVPEIADWLGERLGRPPDPGMWPGLRIYTPLVHAPQTTPWSFGARASFVAARQRPVLGDDEVATTALQTLIRRYLEGFGPAGIADVAQFALVQRARVKSALATYPGELVRLEGPDGKTRYDVPGGLLPPDDVPAPPRLMAMWDSILLATVDRSRVIPPPYRPLVTRSNGDILPTLLVDGYVAGVWRPVDGGIQALAFHPLSTEDWDGLAREARSLLRLLAEREPSAYRRYDHWWRQLPRGDQRVLPGD